MGTKNDQGNACVQSRDILEHFRGATGAACVPKTGKTPIMGVCHHCRHRLLFFQNHGDPKVSISNVARLLGRLLTTGS